jgi:hypothetical protein
LFEFLTQFLAHSPFWCQRLALMQQGETGGAGQPDRQEDDKKIWDEMRTQLYAVLVQGQTFQEFLAYLVDDKRAWSGESPAHAARYGPGEAPRHSRIHL